LEKEIIKSTLTLKQGNLILLPTDTIWGIACDATNELSIEKIYKLKKRKESKTFICLVSDINSLEQIVGSISKKIKNIILNELKPTTIVYKFGKNLPKLLFSSDGSIAIRVVKDKFCRELISKLGKPIIATSANESGKKNPISFDQINPKIIQGVNYIVNLKQDEILKAHSRIISFDLNEKLIELRK
jgi:L-threonylcarbamoyladenylate synthase|tara:strand:+ start:36 stop:596 length:561 start_codon:yes stop_codon:yes gene_type:complete